MLPDGYTSLVGCRLPIQQSPMGSVASPDLVVAVTEAGGVGSITASGMSPGYLAKVLDDVLSRTSGVVAANFLTAEVDVDVLGRVASRVPVVDFFWNEPSARLVDIAHEAGAVVSWQVGSVDEAVSAVAVGVDVVIAQGLEAGGHVRSNTTLLPLLAGVLDAVDVPVLGAGAIGHPRTLAAVLAAGASGARVGTAFIATTESGAHPRYKQAVVDARRGDTLITDTFSKQCPLCATSARHRVLTACVRASQALPDGEIGVTMYGSRAVPQVKGSPLSPSTTTTGHIGAMAMYASDAAADASAIRPAGEVIAWLCDGADTLLTRLH